MSNRVASLNPNLVDSSISVDSPPAVENHEPKHVVPEASSRRNTKTKKIWIDIDNSPHVPFFLPIIDELRKRGFEVELTARDMYQVCQLLEFFNLKCKVIGGHYGKNKVLKVLGRLPARLAIDSHSRQVSRGSGDFPWLTGSGAGLQGPANTDHHDARLRAQHQDGFYRSGLGIHARHDP